MSDFTVFGTRPDNAICLPDIPYVVRLNCKDGGLFVGGHEAQHRKTNPDETVDIAILKVSKFFGSLGKTENALWVQLYYIAAPSVAPHILPPDTICVSYIKKQSIAHLYHKVQEAMQYGEPGRGIFTLGFNKELGALGAYYTVSFNWRERSEEAEKTQLERIANFLVDYQEQLIDIEGTREMTCIDGWKAREIQELVMQGRATQSLEPAPRESKRLKAAKG